ncbi:glycosyltransferase [Commensalibacter melissae]|uniref:glycosyltransferase n=1 Tax=Commensalibacter melissae TaxID=2070537 RepID=UPI001329A083|nr:glycosyltransferase [Commensalibacter melissae]
MKYLFIHQNFPGQYLHIIKYLAGKPDNEIVFVSQVTRRTIGGIRNVFYGKIDPVNELHSSLNELHQAVKRGEEVYQTLKKLKQLGFVPDIIIGHQGWGEMLNVQDIYPDVPILKYCEFYYHSDGLDVKFDPEFLSDELLPSRVRIKNTINLISANNPGWGQTPTLFQWKTYPEWARGQITVLREGVDLKICSPDADIYNHTMKFDDFIIHPKDKLVTYVARGLEPYRGFHILMRSLPKILKERPDAKIVIVGGDQVSYGAALPGKLTWKHYFLQQLGNQLDPTRIYFAGLLSYPVFCKLLKRSDAHVYMTYPFVLSWSLREAMAMGCPIIASDTDPVKEFIVHQKTGILTPFFDKEKLADNVLEVLENNDLSSKIRHFSREEAERSLSMDIYLNNYNTLIDDLINHRTPNLSLGKSPAMIGEEL